MVVAPAATVTEINSSVNRIDVGRIRINSSIDGVVWVRQNCFKSRLRPSFVNVAARSGRYLARYRRLRCETLSTHLPATHLPASAGCPIRADGPGKSGVRSSDP